MMPEGSRADLIRTWDVITRRRRSIFLSFFLTWAIVCSLAWLLPARYRSETTILIEQPKVPQQYVVPNVGSDLQDRLQTLTQQILSRTRLQRIIDDFHLYSEERARLGADDVIEKMRKDITVEPIQAPGKREELTAFKVSYSGPNRQLVQQVTSRLTSLFIEENLQAREQQSESTTEFLDNSLKEARTHLEEQEKRLKEFKAQYIGQLPGELQSNLQILSVLQTRLQEANEALDRSEQQKLYLSSLLSAYQETPSLRNTGSQPLSGSPADVDSELAHLKSELADLKSKYTDRHPAVVQIQGQITKTEKLKAEMEKDRTEGGKNSDSGAPRSPGIVEVQSQLKGVQFDIQNRNKEIAGIEAEIQAYQKRLNRTPVLEEQLADISRDYDQSRANYDSLLAKKNQSALATNLEKNQQGEQFAVLDPPSLPTGPYFPNRLLFTLGGLAAGLAGAGAIVFVREKLDDRLHIDLDVTSVSKFPILVSIPPLATIRDIRRERWCLVGEISSAAVALIVIVASTVLANYFG
jgi:polysaccharide biosynthesis transport protein